MATSLDDAVHGIIRIPAAVKLVLNSPEVQRLRDLHQLGLASYVYPSATHTRFEHSVGCMHLALTLLDNIVENHRNLDVPLPFGGYLPATASPTPQRKAEPGTDEAARLWREADEDRHITVMDRFCVAMAGLCHDIGHGPLSHTFEGLVNGEWRKEEEEEAVTALAHRSEAVPQRGTKGHHERAIPTPPSTWEHEDMGLKLFDVIWHDISDSLREQFGLTRKDKEFVKLMMKGLKASDPFPQARVGRPAWKRFMVDIVANKVHGLDVDKLDYLQRDGLFVGNQRQLYVDRIFQNAFVVPVRPTDKWGAGAHPDTPEGTQYRICYSEKVKENIEAVFDQRKDLHCLVYQHRVVLLANRMVKDALRLCGKVCLIRSRAASSVASMTSHRKTSDQGAASPRTVGTERLARPSSACLTLRESTLQPETFCGTGDWIFGYLRNMDSDTVPLRVPGTTVASGTPGWEAKERAKVRLAQRLLQRVDSRDLYLHLIHIYCETPEELYHAESLGRQVMASLAINIPTLYEKLRSWEVRHGMDALCFERSYFSSATKELDGECSGQTTTPAVPSHSVIAEGKEGRALHLTRSADRGVRLAGSSRATVSPAPRAGTPLGTNADDVPSTASFRPTVIARRHSSSFSMLRMRSESAAPSTSAHHPSLPHQEEEEEEDPVSLASRANSNSSGTPSPDSTLHRSTSEAHRSQPHDEDLVGHPHLHQSPRMQEKNVDRLHVVEVPPIPSSNAAALFASSSAMQVPRPPRAPRLRHPADLVTLVNPREMLKVARWSQARQRMLQRRTQSRLELQHLPGSGGAVGHSPYHYHSYTFSGYPNEQATPSQGTSDTRQPQHPFLLRTGRPLPLSTTTAADPSLWKEEEDLDLNGDDDDSEDLSVIVRESGHLNNRAPLQRQNLKPYTYVYWMCRLNRPLWVATHGGGRGTAAGFTPVRAEGNSQKRERNDEDDEEDFDRVSAKELEDVLTEEEAMLVEDALEHEVWMRDQRLAGYPISPFHATSLAPAPEGTTPSARECGRRASYPPPSPVAASVNPPPDVTTSMRRQEEESAQDDKEATQRRPITPLAPPPSCSTHQQTTPLVGSELGGPAFASPSSQPRLVSATDAEGTKQSEERDDPPHPLRGNTETKSYAKKSPRVSRSAWPQKQPEVVFTLADIQRCMGPAAVQLLQQEHAKRSHSSVSHLTTTNTANLSDTSSYSTHSTPSTRDRPSHTLKKPTTTTTSKTSLLDYSATRIAVPGEDPHTLGSLGLKRARSCEDLNPLTSTTSCSTAHPTSFYSERETMTSRRGEGHAEPKHAMGQNTQEEARQRSTSSSNVHFQRSFERTTAGLDPLSHPTTAPTTGFSTVEPSSSDTRPRAQPPNRLRSASPTPRVPPKPR